MRLIIEQARVGWSPVAVSPREHEAVGPRVDGVGHVARLGARRPRRLRHRLEHLGGHDDRTPHAPRHAEDLPLDDRHALGRELDAEVAARDHDAVARGHDALEVLDRVRRLDLGDDRRGRAPRVADLADLQDVLGAAHEAHRDVVDAAREAERPGLPCPSRSARRCASSCWAGARRRGRASRRPARRARARARPRRRRP